MKTENSDNNSNNKGHCPDCGGAHLIKEGFQTINRAGDRKQVWRCVGCRRRTMNPVQHPNTAEKAKESQKTP